MRRKGRRPGSVWPRPSVHGLFHRSGAGRDVPLSGEDERVTQPQRTTIDVDDVLQRLRNMEALQNRIILEREAVTRAISICLISRSHLLLSGPPGVAKTTQV